LNSYKTNKNKIVNDPVYGFINIRSELIYDLIEHPFFQRLRRIRQLGLTNYVYPAANHTRFQHAQGAMHLMGTAIDVLLSKGNEITAEESEAVTIAILLHDIGHGPFSHALENAIIENINHEMLSEMIMDDLNHQFGKRLTLAIKIFKNQYHKKFLHQLVSSQLDMDRLDYLNRDSFFTGVNEGIIGSERIIKMLDVVNDELVVEAKGIYSIEKYLVARRLMYWQVYLHKTVLAAENLLLKILLRAKQLAMQKADLFATPALKYFLYHDFSKDKISEKNRKEILENFALLDDNDIIVSAKVWASHDDRVLRDLCSNMNNRRLYKIQLQNTPFKPEKISELKELAIKKLGLSKDQVEYYVFSGSISNNAYSPAYEKIEILYNNGTLVDIAEASDMLNLQVLSKIVKKHFICYPKGLA
jgi:uncharacterized protein